ncbi:hypothetical protein LTR50_000692 [Elasticomyces elasticus]|nr:hypothetical protein LTR50_000692 [Elasticomyces elasticus]
MTYRSSPDTQLSELRRRVQMLRFKIDDKQTAVQQAECNIDSLERSLQHKFTTTKATFKDNLVAAMLEQKDDLKRLQRQRQVQEQSLQELQWRMVGDALRRALAVDEGWSEMERRQSVG